MESHNKGSAATHAAPTAQQLHTLAH
jgi:hypothetical protein